MAQRRLELITVGDKKYRLAVMRINSRKPDGRPENVTIIESKDTAELSQDPAHNCFITVWIPVMDFQKFAGQIPTIPDED